MTAFEPWNTHGDKGSDWERRTSAAAAAGVERGGSHVSSHSARRWNKSRHSSTLSLAAEGRMCVSIACRLGSRRWTAALLLWALTDDSWPDAWRQTFEDNPSMCPIRIPNLGSPIVSRSWGICLAWRHRLRNVLRRILWFVVDHPQRRGHICRFVNSVEDFVRFGRPWKRKFCFHYSVFVLEWYAEMSKSVVESTSGSGNMAKYSLHKSYACLYLLTDKMMFLAMIEYFSVSSIAIVIIRWNYSYTWIQWIYLT